MESLALIESRISHNRNYSLNEHHYVLTYSVDMGTRVAYYCTKCKKFILNEQKYRCLDCSTRVIGASEHVVKSKDIIKRTENKLSHYTWSYTPKIVWPKKNKKPSIMRILRVNGISIGINGCYNYNFSFVNGRRIKSNKNKKRTKLARFSSSCSILKSSQCPSTFLKEETSIELFKIFLDEISPSFRELKIIDTGLYLSKKLFSEAQKGTKALIKYLLGRNESSLIKIISHKIKDEGLTPNWKKIHFVCRNLKDINFLRKVLEQNYNERFFDKLIVDYQERNFLTKEYNKRLDKEVRNFIKLMLKYFFTQDKIIKFIESMSDSFETEIVDSARMFLRLDENERKQVIHSINEQKEFSIQEVHRQCVSVINREKNEKLKTPFEYDEKTKGLTYEKDNVSIILPESPFQLQEWGQKMHNCVYSYAHHVKTKESIILGLFIDKKLVANIEIRNNRIQQFRGINNSKVFDELYQKIEVIKNWVKENKLTMNASETSGNILYTNVEATNAGNNYLIFAA